MATCVVHIVLVLLSHNNNTSNFGYTILNCIQLPPPE